MTFHLFFSKEPFQMIFELIRFDSHLFSTCLKHSFYSFPCWFPLLFDPLTFQMYRVVLQIPTSSIVFRALVATAFSTFNISLLQEACIVCFWTFTWSILLAVLLPYIHLALVLILFFYLLLLGKVCHPLLASLAFALILDLFEPSGPTRSALFY